MMHLLGVLFSFPHPEQLSMSTKSKLVKRMCIDMGEFVRSSAHHADFLMGGRSSQAFLLDVQAQDRIHRLGQYKPINVVRFIIGNTIEERILKLQVQTAPSRQCLVFAWMCMSLLAPETVLPSWLAMRCTDHSHECCRLVVCRQLACLSWLWSPFSMHGMPRFRVCQLVQDTLHQFQIIGTMSLCGCVRIGLGRTDKLCFDHGGRGRSLLEAVGGRLSGIQCRPWLHDDLMVTMIVNMRAWSALDQVRINLSKVVLMQEKKQLVFEGTVGRDAEALGRLTEDDLRFLFG